MRAAAIALIVAAFARPFLRQAAAAAGGDGGTREIVILLDQSASMGYGDHWQRAQRCGARRGRRGLGADDKATLVLFSRNAEENMRATSDRATARRPRSARAKVGRRDALRSGAETGGEHPGALARCKRREAVLISDFQRTGWSGSEDVQLPRRHDAHDGVGRGADRPRTSRCRRWRSRDRRSPARSASRVTAGLSNKERRR